MLESAPPGNAVIAAPASPPRLRVGPPRDWAAGFPGVDPTICRFSSLAAPGQLQSPLVRLYLDTTHEPCDNVVEGGKDQAQHKPHDTIRNGHEDQSSDPKHCVEEGSTRPPTTAIVGE